MLIEIFQTEIQKEKRITKTKSRREYQSIMGQFQKYGINIIGMPEGEKRTEEKKCPKRNF